MRGALIHGALLVVMLVYGYRTWTRDKTIPPDLGSIVLWNKGASDLTAFELKAERKTTRIERRGQGADSYWWGVETSISKLPKSAAKQAEEAAKAAAGSGSGAGSAGSGSAGSAAGSGSSAGSAGSSAGSAGSDPATAALAEDEVRKVHEFPLGEAGDKLIKALTEARALRDLGKPTEEQRKEFKLVDSKTLFTVTFKDGARTFLVGGSVYGGSDRYVVDQQSGRAYVLARDMITPLEIGESSLHLLDARGFDLNKLQTVTIEANGKSKTVARVQTGVEGQQIKTWGDPATKKADGTIANFLDNTNNLRPTEYLPDVKIADLTLVLTLTYKDSDGGKLGTMRLFKREKEGELPPGAELDPANPPKGVLEYLIVTEKTRIPALVRKDTAARTEQDITTVFGEHPLTVEPKGNPLGTNPLPPNAPRSPHGSGAGSAGSGSAAGSAAAGSAASGSAAPAGDAPKPGAKPAGDAPKPAGDAAKPAGAAPAKADAPKAAGSGITPNPAPAALQGH